MLDHMLSVFGIYFSAFCVGISVYLQQAFLYLYDESVFPLKYLIVQLKLSEAFNNYFFCMYMFVITKYNENFQEK